MNLMVCCPFPCFIQLKFSEVFAKHNIEVEEEVIQEISNIVFENNPVLVTTSEKGKLSADYRRNRYFREHFSIIEPTELLYDRTSRKAFVYVSVIQVRAFIE